MALRQDILRASKQIGLKILELEIKSVPKHPGEVVIRAIVMKNGSPKGYSYHGKPLSGLGEAKFIKWMRDRKDQ